MAKSASKGTAFKIDNQVVGSLSSIGGVSVSADTLDVTALDNSTGYKEFLGGFKDGGEVSLSGFFDYADAGQKALYEAFESGEAVECSINFPQTLGCKWTFDGVVTAYGTSVETEDAITFECTVKVSGKPTLAAST